MGQWNPQVERKQAWNDLSETTLAERVDILLDERHCSHNLEQKRQALQAERDKLHDELVAVRAELAKVTEERDRLRKSDGLCFIDAKDWVPTSEFVPGGRCKAHVIYTEEPSPETGHVGWCWMARGRMGDAPTLADAIAQAESALAKPTS